MLVRKWYNDNPATPASAAEFDAIARYAFPRIQRTRRMAPGGGRPPRVCGAGANCLILASKSDRGRVCRAMLAAFCQAPRSSRGVTSAGRVSSLPAMTSSVGISVVSFLRKSARSCCSRGSTGRHQARQRAIIEQERSARGSGCADNALAAVDGQQHPCDASPRRRNRHDPLSAELFLEESAPLWRPPTPQ